MYYWTICMKSEGHSEFGHVVAKDIMTAIRWAKHQYNIGDKAIFAVYSSDVDIIK